MTAWNKYVKIRDYVKDKDKRNEHYYYCKKNRLPCITVCEAKDYAEIIVDFISMSPEIVQYSEIVNEKFEHWVDDAIKSNLIRVDKMNAAGLCPRMVVKKQCADYYAEQAFDIYMDFWKSYGKLIIRQETE